MHFCKIPASPDDDDDVGQSVVTNHNHNQENKVNGGCQINSAEHTSPPPGPWGDKIQFDHRAGSDNAAAASSVHVDMGKVVGVLRATAAHQLAAEDENLDEDEDDSSPNTFNEDDHEQNSLVLDEETEACASCQAEAAGNSSHLLHPNKVNLSFICKVHFRLCLHFHISIGPGC